MFLIALAFGLLGYTIWDNRVQMREVLGRDLDPWLFALGFAIYMTALVLTFFRWFLLVRRSTCRSGSATRSASASSATSSTW